jgi:hypothetical protein
VCGFGVPTSPRWSHSGMTRVYARNPSRDTRARNQPVTHRALTQICTTTAQLHTRTTVALKLSRAKCPEPKKNRDSLHNGNYQTHASWRLTLTSRMGRATRPPPPFPERPWGPRGAWGLTHLRGKSP